MLKKQSSSELSSLASRVLRGYQPTPEEVKRLAASVLAQDERRGQGFMARIVRKFSGEG